MRSEEEILKLILDTAREDERIRAVILNGSRANPNVPKDIFQDFDIVYIVTMLDPFIHNLVWIQRFGDMMILQLPEEMGDPAPVGDGHYTYLMQFNDGNRIDLSLFSIDQLHQLERDSLSIVLMDKDSLMEGFPSPSEVDYLPKPPTPSQYADCCNEFWWVSPYVAKGLWRNEIIYAKTMLDHYVRDQLNKMIIWYIGVNTGFARNPGKYGKYYQRYLEPELWDLLLATYSGASNDEIWRSLISAGTLFRRIALNVADHFGYDYPHSDDSRVSAHLHHVMLLPKDALEIYHDSHSQSPCRDQTK